MNLHARWHRFAFEEFTATPESLSLFRLFLATLLLSQGPRYTWISQFPDSFFNPPPGFTYFFFTGFPPQWFFRALDVTILVALVFLIAGRHVMLASVLVTGALLAGNAWAYSFGKIDHDILQVLTPAFLAVAGWDGRSPVRRWPLALFAVVIGLAMLTAAAPKVATGWLDTGTHAVFGHAIFLAVFNEHQPPVWKFAIGTLPPFAWEAMDYSTVLLEASFIIAVVRRRTFLAICAIACLFHLGVVLLMHITFLANVVAYAAFVAWDKVMIRLGVMNPIRRLQEWLSGRSTVQLLIAAAIFVLITIGWRNPLGALLSAIAPGGVGVTIIWVAALSAIVFLLSELRVVLTGRSRTHADA
jgi:hypothetical protein